MSMCLSNLGQALKLVVRSKHLFRMVSFDVRLGTLHHHHRRHHHHHHHLFAFMCITNFKNIAACC